MAESLGAAVLTVSVDDQQFQAGLQRVQQSAAQAGGALTRNLGGAQAGQSLTGLTIKLNSLQQELQQVTIGTKRFNELRREIEATQKALNNANGIGAGAGVLGQLATGLAGLGVGAAVGSFFKGSIDAAVELETITRKLSNTLGAQGAGAALAYTRGLSDQLGLSFKTLAGSFGSFTAAATAANMPLEDQKALFGAVSKAAQALGLSNDEINGSLLALQQVASKGTVQMEELRGQLGERLPIAFAATAQGLGVTQTQLIKLVESGKLTAQQFFPALTKGLNDLTSASSGTATAAQNFQKLANAWDDLQTSFGKNLLPKVTEQVQLLTELLNSLKIPAEANQLGLGGLFGNLGLVPDQAIQAVAAVRALKEEYKLTDQQARALFYDAANKAGMKMTGTGFLPDARALEETLKKLPGLAAEFQAKWGGGNKDLLKQKQILGELTDLATKRYAKQSQEVSQVMAVNKLIQTGKDDITKAYGLYQQLRDPKIGASSTQINDAAELVKKSYGAFREVMVEGAKEVASILETAVQRLTSARLSYADLLGSKDKGLNQFLNPEQQQLRLRNATASLGTELERSITIGTQLLKEQGISLDKSLIEGLRSIIAGAQGKPQTVGSINGKPIQSVVNPNITADNLKTVQDFIGGVLTEYNARQSVQDTQAKVNEINAALLGVNQDLAKQVSRLADKNWAVSVNVAADGSVKTFGDLLPAALQ